MFDGKSLDRSKYANFKLFGLHPFCGQGELVSMLSAYYKWIFSLRGKKVSRLKHQPARSQLFKRLSDSILARQDLVADRKKLWLRRAVRAFVIFGGGGFLLGFAWLVWESLKVFQVF